MTVDKDRCHRVRHVLVCSLRRKSQVYPANLPWGIARTMLYHTDRTFGLSIISKSRERNDSLNHISASSRSDSNAPSVFAPSRIMHLGFWLNLILERTGCLVERSNYAWLMLITGLVLASYMRERYEIDRFSWDATECQMIPNGAKPILATPIYCISRDHLGRMRAQISRFTIITWYSRSVLSTNTAWSQRRRFGQL